MKYNTAASTIVQMGVVLASLWAALAVLEQVGLVSPRAMVISSLAASAIFVCAAVIMLRSLGYDTRRISAQLRDIERDINRRVGEDLLVWESRYGWRGAFRRPSGIMEPRTDDAAWNEAQPSPR
jgi:hypothetical protein